jgi:hypothetical protein
VARDPDQRVVGRAFSSTAVELALASYPGFSLTSAPGDGSPYGVFTPAYVDAHQVRHLAVLPDGTRVDIPPANHTQEIQENREPPLPPMNAGTKTKRVPLGTIAAARSGDKGGNANIGVWVRTDAQWRWLVHALTTQQLRQLLPETENLTVTRTVLPSLRAVNFVIEGILGQGVAYHARFDPQAKGLGEWLRSRHIDIPADLL